MVNRESRMQRDWSALRNMHRADLPAATAAMARDFVARHPDCGPAWRILGSALTALADYAGAKEAIHRASALCPVDMLWIPLSEMGHLHKARGDYEAAECWYRRARDAAPSNAGPRIYLGAVLALGGRLAAAEGEFRAAAECDEGRRDEALLNLGMVLRAQGRHHEAVAAAEAALAIDPKYAAAKRLLRDLKLAESAVAKAAARDAKEAVVA